MITAALRGELDKVEYKEHPVFGVSFPTSCPNVPAEILDPRGTWKDKAAIRRHGGETGQAVQRQFRQVQGRRQRRDHCRRARRSR